MDKAKQKINNNKKIYFKSSNLGLNKKDLILFSVIIIYDCIRFRMHTVMDISQTTHVK